ncbi:MAG: glycoside hydrolase family 5 protein [Verrucomicrobia bacterium]|nr:glycoside hydrolase family 5 protein [Verrucomicrobiota bacterium]
MTRTLLPLFALATALSAQEPIRQAAEARLWLKVPAGQAPLRGVVVSNGSATPAAWEKDPAVRERHTDVVFPIRWWAWSDLSITFTPAQDGSVEVVLCGPWAQDKIAGLVRQEILWDDLSAVGTTLQNGGFEETADKHPAAWQTPWAPYPSAAAWPLAGATPLTGKCLAATWHNRPLAQTLQLKAGQKVVLRLHAKAATPPNFTPPQRLGADTPAHRALAGLKRGVNLGNGWEAPPPYTWGIRFTTEDIDRIAAEGFDHLRVPVAFHYHLKPGTQGWELSPTLLTDLEPVLRRALDKNLRVLLDWHHFNDLTADPAANVARFVGGWQAIARHFQAWPPGLFLELLNEPCAALTTTAANPIYQQAIAAIRAIDPTRILVVSPGNWGQVSELDQLRLPDADERLIVTFHCYEPFHFTHQGASWVQLQDLRGVVYPGPPDQPLQLPDSLRDNAGVRAFIEAYNTRPAAQNPCSARAVMEALDGAREWSRYFGRPIHLGEFGCHNVGDLASRGRYLKDVRTLAEARKIPWTLWEWKASFGYWDPAKNQPRFRSSLFE